MNTSIIESRPDFAAIAQWIPQGSSVLDLGCGDGSLLRYLRETREVRGYGVEINDKKIATCIANGVNVIQNDLDSGLADFEDQSFDFVILSQTLQATRHTEALMKEIVRVGREGIISFAVSPGFS
jgi:methionine biosynthesis protein MetW